MKAKIHAKDGEWADARAEADRYAGRVKDERDKVEVKDLQYAIHEGEGMAKKAMQARRAQLPTVCMEAASEAIKTATHSVPLRQLRADCALGAGDVDQAVGDLMCVSHLYPCMTRF